MIFELILRAAIGIPLFITGLRLIISTFKQQENEPSEITGFWESQKRLQTSCSQFTFGLLLMLLAFGLLPY